MEILNYDFSSFEQAIFNFRTDSQTTNELQELKNELNSFFKDSTCREIIFTENTDKMFFGIFLVPYMTSDDAMKVVSSDERMRINQYYLEIDSKLLGIGLNNRELLAILVSEVGRMVNTSEPVEKVRQAIDIYLEENNTHIKLSDANQYKDILGYGIKDAIRKMDSVFEISDCEIIANEFIARLGYGEDFENAHKKIILQTGHLNRIAENKLVTLEWVLRLYPNVDTQRVGSIKILESVKVVTPSQLQIREMNIVIRALEQIDDDILIQEGLDIFKATNDIYKKFKYKGMRSLEDDIYELKIRVKNVDVEDDALALLRQINMRLSLIDDYVSTEKISESELDRWTNLTQKYLLLRDELSKKVTCKDKYYGLFVQTPVVSSNNRFAI